MRKWIDIIAESIWPERVSNEQLVAMGREGDEPGYHAGDTNVYWAGRGATLQTLPVDALEHGNPVADDVVDIYSGMSTQAPPVIVDGNVVEDGNHRLAAARARGDKTILAYVLETK